MNKIWVLTLLSFVCLSCNDNHKSQTPKDEYDSYSQNHDSVLVPSSNINTDHLKKTLKTATCDKETLISEDHQSPFQYPEEKKLNNIQYLSLSHSSNSISQQNSRPQNVIDEMSFISKIISTNSKEINFPNVGEQIEFTTSDDEIWTIYNKQLLGSGGLGTVHHTIITSPNGDECEYAVKTPYLIDENYELTFLLFEKEVNNTLLFNRSNHFINLYAKIYFKNTPSIWLELAQGDLVSTQEKISVKGYLKLLEGLSYLKEINMTHGDIKPSNILVNKNGDWILGDLGGAAPAKFGCVNFFHFTPLFVAPELWNVWVHEESSSDSSSYNCLIKCFNYQKYDPYKPDIYSLGASMFFLYYKSFAHVTPTNHDSISENHSEICELNFQNAIKLSLSAQEYILSKEDTIEINNKIVPKNILARAIFLSIEYNPSNRIDLENLYKLLTQSEQNESIAA